jgi:hypothetical protein
MRSHFHWLALEALVFFVPFVNMLHLCGSSACVVCRASTPGRNIEAFGGIHRRARGLGASPVIGGLRPGRCPLHRFTLCAALTLYRALLMGVNEPTAALSMCARVVDSDRGHH